MNLLLWPFISYQEFRATLTYLSYSKKSLLLYCMSIEHSCGSPECKESFGIDIHNQFWNRINSQQYCASNYFVQGNAGLKIRRQLCNQKVQTVFRYSNFTFSTLKLLYIILYYYKISTWPNVGPHFRVHVPANLQSSSFYNIINKNHQH